MPFDWFTVFACCGQWRVVASVGGSIIHQLWTGNVMWHPSRITERLLMREAGLASSNPTTEAVVQEVSRYLAERRGMDPFVKRTRHTRAARPLDLAPEPVQIMLRMALREPTYTQTMAKTTAERSTLSVRPAVHEALDRAMRLGRDGELEALPLFHVDKRLASRDRAASVHRDALADWLQSEEAASWRKARANIFGGGERLPIMLPLDCRAADSGPG